VTYRKGLARTVTCNVLIEVDPCNFFLMEAEGKGRKGDEYIIV